jgi:hypothetical protein
VMSTRSTSLRQRGGTGVFDFVFKRSNMFRVVVVFGRVTAVLAFEIHLVLFDVGGEDIVRVHAEDLRHADEKVKQIHDLDAGVLFVEFLIFGPPFPRNAVGQFSQLLLHGARVVQQPFGFIRFGHAIGLDTNAFVQGFLHPKEFAELVGIFHGAINRQDAADAKTIFQLLRIHLNQAGPGPGWFEILRFELSGLNRITSPCCQRF